MEDEILTDEETPADIDRELWPVPPRNHPEEFEDYLMDLDLRF